MELTEWLNAITSLSDHAAGWREKIAERTLDLEARNYVVEPFRKFGTDCSTARHVGADSRHLRSGPSPVM